MTLWGFMLNRLGLEVQRAAIAEHVGNGKVIAEYVEVETGKNDERPELKKGLHRAKVTGATVLIVPFRGPKPSPQAKDRVDEVASCDDIGRALTPSTT